MILNFYTTEPGKYPEKKEEAGEDEFIGNGWSVKKIDERFFLTYLSGSLQGELKTIEISGGDFKSAREGLLQLEDFCIKYGVY
ncbi:hypothetical protein [Pedobacter sp. SYSU D00535]|uniref:hypothetical protein n=1 Tax=Pedobacter sp. SYSU D00535 TaxID=2810308 RepID=UPI001A9754BB|nr:hypothetical protein [Pedobacter sp. SYSU D00535]